MFCAERLTQFPKNLLLFVLACNKIKLKHKFVMFIDVAAFPLRLLFVCVEFPF